MLMTLTAEAVYGIQRDRDMAWSRVAGCGDPSVLTAGERAYQRELVAEYERLDAELRAARGEIGGRVYLVPTENVEGLTKRVEKINRRAAKLNVEPVHFVVTGEHRDLTKLHEITGEIVEVVPRVFVVVGAQVVKLAGWRFAATIEHDDEGNIIRQVPGVEADLSAYREAAAWCFHCKTVRRRIDTFVVLHEDGRTEQIGRNCLVDFLGADAKYAAQQAEWLRELIDAFDDAEESASGIVGDRTVPLDEFLTHVALSIRTSKWTSRGVAREYGGAATADHAARNLRECRAAGYRPATRDDEYHELPDAQDAQTAAAAIEWAREEYGAKPIDERDDFEHNMAVAVAHDYLPTRRTGLAAYAVQAYLKATEQEIRREAAAVSKFVGTEGKREEFELTVARIVAITDRYSYDDATKPLYLFVDGAGNSVKWFASSWAADLKVGETYTVKGTVKRHENDPEYGKSTIITRCKVQG